MKKEAEFKVWGHIKFGAQLKSARLSIRQRENRPCSLAAHSIAVSLGSIISTLEMRTLRTQLFMYGIQHRVAQ